jgi:hypothetical protein
MPDAEKHGYSGLARIIYAAEGAEIIRFHSPNPPNSRSILDLQKNGTDAENRAVIRADGYADIQAETSCRTSRSLK